MTIYNNYGENINNTHIIQVKFGVPFFDIYDPKFMHLCVPVAVRGTVSFFIKDFKEFIKLRRTRGFDLENFQKQIKDATVRHVKAVVSNFPSKYNVPLLQLETKIDKINDIIEYDLSEKLFVEFGIKVSAVDISAIEMDKSCEEYNLLVETTRGVKNLNTCI